MGLWRGGQHGAGPARCCMLCRSKCQPALLHCACRLVVQWSSPCPLLVGGTVRASENQSPPPSHRFTAKADITLPDRRLIFGFSCKVRGLALPFSILLSPPCAPACGPCWCSARAPAGVLAASASSCPGCVRLRTRPSLPCPPCPPHVTQDKVFHGRLSVNVPARLAEYRCGPALCCYALPVLPALCRWHGAPPACLHARLPTQRSLPGTPGWQRGSGHSRAQSAAPCTPSHYKPHQATTTPTAPRLPLPVPGAA